ncbi:GntR family transcriptional regulator [Actinoplanes sp. NPDC049596]
MPTENDMHAEWGVARTTARWAVNLLRERGSVYTVPQRGSFVNPG